MIWANTGTSLFSMIAIYSHENCLPRSSGVYALKFTSGVTGLFERGGGDTDEFQGDTLLLIWSPSWWRGLAPPQFFMVTYFSILLPEFILWLQKIPRISVRGTRGGGHTGCQVFPERERPIVAPPLWDATTSRSYGVCVSGRLIRSSGSIVRASMNRSRWSESQWDSSVSETVLMLCSHFPLSIRI